MVTIFTTKAKKKSLSFSLVLIHSPILASESNFICYLDTLSIWN